MTQLNLLTGRKYQNRKRTLRLRSQMRKLMRNGMTHETACAYMKLMGPMRYANNLLVQAYKMADALQANGNKSAGKEPERNRYPGGNSALHQRVYKHVRGGRIAMSGAAEGRDWVATVNQIHRMAQDPDDLVQGAIVRALEWHKQGKLRQGQHLRDAAYSRVMSEYDKVRKAASDYSTKLSGLVTGMLGTNYKARYSPDRYVANLDRAEMHRKQEVALATIANDRQRILLAMLLNGYTQKECAEWLGISNQRASQLAKKLDQLGQLAQMRA
jgi:DNA-directed RNA polymerase specialized sigma24 family protein